MPDHSLEDRKIYYLDHAATTPAAPEVIEKMLPYFAESYGNPSALYPMGLKAKKAVRDAKKQVADLMHADSEKEIIFTSGGTEADNWVLRGVCDMYAQKGKKDIHIITTRIEHHAVINTCRYLEKTGVLVTYLAPDSFGRITPRQVEEAIRPETVLISVMFANNEIGTIEPIAKIGEIAAKHHILFHTDAVQAFGHEEIDVNALQVDYLSASAHKLNGPKGVGCLYVRKGKSLPPLLYGGAQEYGRRAGTENTAGIIGFGEACRLASERMAAEKEYLTGLRDRMIKELLEGLPGSRLNGDPVNRLANNISLLLPGIEGEKAVGRLELMGICAGSGSACASGAAEPSHVLRAIGCTYTESFCQLRLTIGPELTEEDASYVTAASIETLGKM